MKRATKVGRLNGRNVYRVPVVVRFNDSSRCETVAEMAIEVLAPSAADAANWARDNEAGNRPETEIIAYGPKGGETCRYIGWYSAISNALFNQHNHQLRMPI